VKFNKVTTNHIFQAVEDFNSIGFPTGFGHSSTYDVLVNGEKYPPKTIMAYANFYATGQEPNNDFNGGEETDCFKAYERLGLQVLQKSKFNLTNDLAALKESFLKKWTLESLNNLSLNEYSNLNKDSFCYWVEHETDDLGGVRGGSSYKFGIYKMGGSSGTQPATNRTNDGEYAWHIKYGEIRNEAFSNIKSIIIKIATLSQEGRFSEIEEIDLGDAFKWKIAFLYSNYKLMNIFKHSALNTSAEYLGYEDSDHSYTALNEFILSKKGDQDFYDFAKDLWKVFDNRDERRELFEQWLNSQQSVDSGKATSYLRAIDILENEFDITVYSEDDLSELDELYGDLKLHQKNDNGKYFYSKAKSYGQGGFYSAAIGTFILFLKEDPAKSKNEHDFINLLRLFGQDNVQNYYKLLSEFLSDLGINKNDERVHYTYRRSRKRFGLTIGQKYAVMAEIKKGEIIFGHFDTLSPSDDWWKIVPSINSLIDAKATIIKSGKIEFSKTLKSGFKKHSSKILENSIFDQAYRSELFSKAFKSTINPSDMNLTKFSELNQIFFGPPGTGKTFNTINEAVRIADPDFYEKHKNDRALLKERFKLLTINSNNESVGQIRFTTFHQSFSYEDFVEGIKPLNPNESESLQYHIEEGVFKGMCRLAKDSVTAVENTVTDLLSLDKKEFDNTHFFKMSLGNTQNQEDSEVYEYCIENNFISLGFGNGLDFTNKDEREIKSLGQKEGLGRFDVQAMNLFCNDLKVGNYVVISNGNSYVRAIGKVIGEYEYTENSPFPNNNTWNHFRKVDWLFNDGDIPSKEIYNKNLSQQSIYKLQKKEIKKEFFIKELAQGVVDMPKNPKNYILIIDEINRGNISSIFGELITLIEKDKREGMDEELSVVLPYSKTEFKVPKNLYIIGTMNTADRSVEALDTALRRRFSFKEMPPKPDLIKEVGSLSNSSGMVGDVDVVAILRTINDRIEKLIDKDHKIGHSYFLDVTSELDLIVVFRDKVIPLLEEYFFGDLGKISLVMGSSFISKTSQSDTTFATNHEYDSTMAEDLTEKSIYMILPEHNWDFKSIYQ